MTNKERNSAIMIIRRAARCSISCLFVFFMIAGSYMAGAVELKSPDGRIAVNFDMKDIGNWKACPTYSVSYEGRPVLVESRMGLKMRDVSLTRNLRVVGQTASTSDTTWKPLLAERSTIRDHYNQLVVELQTIRASSRARRLTITFRAYNEGIAFSYSLPRENNGMFVDIEGEATQFAFDADYPAWAIYAAQADYLNSNVPISQIKPGAERPLTVELSSNLYASITEARISNYARMKLRRSEGAQTTLEAVLDAERDGDGVGFNGEVMGKTPFATPWRVVMIADSPGKLLEQNYLVLNLNDPSELTDTSWIKPGKVIRETTLTTAGGKACIDFAVKHHLQYIEYDAGWYGPEGEPTSDAREVAPERRSALNLHEVIEYGNSKGIGVILYINHLVMEQQLDEVLPLYEKWGVKGVKFGFVNVGSQYWTALVHEAIRKAAAHHLMVDVHDEFRNMGYQRTYPNLITVEGIRGNEEFPTPTHNAALPFTRFLTGPADYTFCWSDKRLKNTKAHQMALSTIFFSPWQFLYWYDKPSAVPDEPAQEYWDHLPTTWDETHVLQGAIGKRAVVARRKGDEWYLGAIAPVDGNFPIALAFLPAGVKFKASIYSDDPDTHGVHIEERIVDSAAVLNAAIPPNGGIAIRLVPAGANEDGHAAAAAEKEGQPPVGGQWGVRRATITDPSLPRVLLVGDSIAIGYGERVAARLKGKANVDVWVTPNWLGPELNRQAQAVLKDAGYSVIHFNESGLHAWAPGRIPDGQYGPLMQSYLAVLKSAAPHARLIWASTTPVTEAGHTGKTDELDKLIAGRNALCEPMMRQSGIAVDDLHILMMNHLDMARGDRFHWTDAGYELLAESAAKSIEQYLSTDKKAH
jgi:alpha-glucosidase